MKKRLKVLLAAVLALSLIGAAALLIINRLVVASAQGAIVSPEAAATLDADCVLVLGAGVYPGGSPSPMLADRLDEGISLYNLGASDKLLVSGDHGTADYDEVNVMKDYAVAAGVPSEDVFMDHAGFSTYESLYRTRDVFEAEKIVIVTQKYHMYRALYIAKALGLEAYGVCSDPRSYAGQTFRDLRELIARAKDFVKCLLKPEPTYLGDPIPVFGNGDATNDR